MTHIGPPDRHEAAEYYYTYIDQVPAGDIRQVLSSQLDDVVAVLGGISEEKSRHRYAPDKWTIRQLVSHLNDTERVFSFRAFWFARGYETPMPSFDQDLAIALAGADERSWQSLIDEFRSVRSATVDLFHHLPDAAWSRRGIASDNPVSVRALAYITAGHVAHHLRILRDRYLPS
jgi:DinB superfamily